MLVVRGLRDRNADLMQLRRPREEHRHALDARVLALEPGQQHLREVADALRLRPVDLVAARELLDRHLADVAMVHASEEVPEDAVAQRPLRHRHLDERELREHPGHDGDAARQHRNAVLAKPGERELAHVSRGDQLVAQPREPGRGDAALRLRIPREDLRDRARGARGGHRLLPAFLLEARGDRLHLLARGELGLLERLLLDAPLGKIPVGEAHAAHVEALHRLGPHLVADDELGGAAADVHHQAVVAGERQRVRDAQVDEARLLAARDDLDGEAEGLLGALEKGLRVLRDAQGVGADHAHRLGRHACQALGEALQRGQCALLRRAVELALRGEPARQAHGLLQRVEGIDLVFHHAADGKVEAVGAEVDRAEGGIFHEHSSRLDKRRGSTKHIPS